MTTRSFSTVLDQTSDAGFRAWGGEANTQLLACGLTQTSDTGQINWSTVTRPAASTSAGYEIYRFNDTLQSTAPIFIKIEYGAANTTATPAIWVTVGTGSNGSGTISGIFFARQQITPSNPAVSVATSYPSYICYSATMGFLGFAHKSGARGANTQGYDYFAIARTTDDSAVTTATGVIVYATGTSANSATSVNFATGYSATCIAREYSLGHFGLTSTTDGANQQVYQHYQSLPGTRIVTQKLSVLSAEFPPGSSFQATPQGTTPHTYLPVGLAAGTSVANSSSASLYSHAMLWE